MTVAIVTAWQNHLELAGDYFAAVEAGQPDQLVIVDDASDPALEFASLRVERSLGFCGANNLALAEVETDLVVFLNNDVAPLRAGWLKEMAAHIEAGVITGPILANDYCTVDGVAYPYVDGWCLGMTVEDARRLGPWDEQFDVVGPGYFSDTWLAFGARMQGFRLREVRPGLRHKGGQTGGVDLHRFNEAVAVNGDIYRARVRAALVGEPVAA